MKAILTRMVGRLLRIARATLPAPILVVVARAMRASGLHGSARRFLDSYLARRPDDDAVRLLHATCLSDAGCYSSSLDAFKHLLATRPTDPEVWMGMGTLHLAKGDVPSAVAAMRAAYEHGDRAGSMEWLTRWGFRPGDAVAPQVATPSSPGRWLFDMTDVLLYLDTNITVSGIQRVVINICEGIDETPTAFDGRSVCCWLDPANNSYREVPVQAFRYLCSVLQGGAEGASIAAAVRRCREGPMLVPVSGDTLIVLGAFWISRLYFEVIFALRGRGVRFGLYLYDLLPVTNPEFFEPELAETFSKSLGDVLLLSDFAITISEYTREQAAAFAKERLGRDLPIAAVPLAHKMKSFDTTRAVHPDVAKACRSRFVLCVGTIEVRKNHRYLVEIWRALLEERGPEFVPDLVIVGRWGWRVEKLQRELQESGYLSGKVRVLGGVGDADLSRLYEHALFSVFPSMAEGWGLPIGESLAHGTPCIASFTTAMPEAGGDFATYIDPYDPASGRLEILRALDDPTHQLLTRERLRSDFVTRTWSDVVREFESVLTNLVRLFPAQDSFATLEQGCIYRNDLSPAVLTAREASDQRVLRLCLVSGWERDESEAVWASSRSSVLRFHVNGIEPSARLRVGLRLSVPSQRDPVEVQAFVGDEFLRLRISGRDAGWYFINAAAGPSGRVEISLVVDGPVWQPDPKRPRFLSFHGICVVDADDVPQRLRILEMLLSS